jgi:hypothetical protein
MAKSGAPELVCSKKRQSKRNALYEEKVQEF